MSDRLRIGITMFPTDTAMAPDAFARAVEERGFDAIAFPEHTHIPVSRMTPFPGGEPIPEFYKRTHDPFIALTAAAMATERIGLWSGISLIAQRDPIVTAKVVASLDVLSHGRVTLGIGYGWNKDEAEQHGIRFADRRAIVRERVLAMQRLWTDDEASFKGEHVVIEPSWSWPKPHGHVPIVLGAAPGPKTFEHIAEFCDGWMPIAGAGSVSASLPALGEALAARGRSLDDIDIVVFGSRPDPERIEYYRSSGVGWIFLGVAPEGEDAVLCALDAYAPLLG